MFNDQDPEFDNNKLTIIASFTVNRGPTTDNDLSIKINVDDYIENRSVVRFNATLERRSKVSVRDTL